jgi:hypothetical protein
LCRLGTVYTASYAAVPHLLALAQRNPLLATYDYLLLPTTIEIARGRGRGPPIPLELRADYFAAIRNIPLIVGAIGARPLDETWCLICGAAIATCNGHSMLAEAILQLEGTTELPGHQAPTTRGARLSG